VVIYEVITGQPHEFDPLKDHPFGPATAIWLGGEDFPNIDNIWLGSIIEICWKKGAFHSTRDLSAVLDPTSLE
jgi:hypothetical protein